MTLDEALKQFEDRFKTVASSPDQQGSKDLPVYWSGGKREWDETSAVLCATKEMAVQMWYDALPSVQRYDNKLTWVLRPELLEFQITIADKMGRHRAVNSRFAVKSQLKMEKVDG